MRQKARERDSKQERQKEETGSDRDRETERSLVDSLFDCAILPLILVLPI